MNNKIHEKAHTIIQKKDTKDTSTHRTFVVFMLDIKDYLTLQLFDNPLVFFLAVRDTCRIYHMVLSFRTFLCVICQLSSWSRLRAMRGRIKRITPLDGDDKTGAMSTEGRTAATMRSL